MCKKWHRANIDCGPCKTFVLTVYIFFVSRLRSLHFLCHTLTVSTHTGVRHYIKTMPGFYNNCIFLLTTFNCSLACLMWITARVILWERLSSLYYIHTRGLAWLLSFVNCHGSIWEVNTEHIACIEVWNWWSCSDIVTCKYVWTRFTCSTIFKCRIMLDFMVLDRRIQPVCLISW